MGYDPGQYEPQPQQQVEVIQAEPVFYEEEDVPYWLHEDFSWWWTGVFVPIVIALIIHRQIKKKVDRAITSYDQRHKNDKSDNTNFK